MSQNNLTISQRRELKRREEEKALSKIPLNSDIIVADVSGSMSDEAFEGRTRYDCLVQALAPFKGRVQLMAFSDHATECAVDTLPLPSGGTRLHEALARVANLEPIHVLVISDGQPDGKEPALLQADIIAPQAIIDVLYIGPQDNDRAIEFMKDLARRGHGRFQMFDTKKYDPKLLSQGADRMLALPNPKSDIEL